MHRTTILIPDDLWRTVQERAAARDVSAAQYIREAVLAISYYELGREDIATALRKARSREGASGSRR